MGLVLVKDLLCQKKNADEFKASLAVIKIASKLGIEKEWGWACANLPPTEIGKKYP
jgi:hypothetical protein